MSYDFAVLLPECADATEPEVLARASEVSGSAPVAATADPRLLSLLGGLEAAGATDAEDGWVSVWPIEPGEAGLAVPTTYADVDGNLVTLLRLAAADGLVLVDLNSQQVHRPAPGRPVGVMAGDGTRLGALTPERLSVLLAELPPEDPWLVLESGPQQYVQTYREPDGTFLFEWRDGAPGRHFRTSLTDPEAVGRRMNAWLGSVEDWGAGLDWERVEV